MKLHPKVDEYLSGENKWQQELRALREILLSCGLDEEYKWGSPIYTFQGRNVAGIRGFKEHLAIWFNNGALLKDSHKVLLASSENTQALRKIEFCNIKEVMEHEQILREYLFEMIELEKAGVKVAFKKSDEMTIPEEFKARLEAMPDLMESFNKLTPGRQRDYCRHFAEPKQSLTRESRIEKCIPQILAGMGLNDKYKC
ncbi:MAG: YdeI/OmpD-associated family protein [Bacteroidales bacterium]|nr:YdeI/OmpD-associated family protein [Bacteroidales bacterium]